MAKRFIDYLPSELAAINRNDFLQGIKASEGRTVCAYVCPGAPNLVEHVSNLELVSSFGADYVNLEGYNPKKLIMPGMESKNSQDDDAFKEVLLSSGKGYSIPELQKFVGRPLGMSLLVKDYPEQEITGLMENSVYSKELFIDLVDAGYTFIVICGLNPDTLVEAVKEAREAAGDTVVIEAGTPHGPGDANNYDTPYNLKKLVTPEYVADLARAGADIVDVPAVGVTPGYTIEYVEQLVDAIHEESALAAACIAHSIEGADSQTLRRIALDNKICGCDITNLAAAGYFEAVALPDALMDVCIAVKGKRYTYRRMAQSVNR